jgi:hypothetical protein
MRITVLIFLLYFLLNPNNSIAQQIEFGRFYDETSISAYLVQNLNFGSVIRGDPTPYSIDIGSEDEAVIEIEGFPFLDVLVTITPIQYLTIDGHPCADEPCDVSVNLSYAYTNNGISDFAPGYENQVIIFNGPTARFPIVRRVSTPPGPPPPPVIQGVSLPPLASAFIYIYGQLTSQSGTPTGSYSQILEVTIDYQ